jgi:DNA-binding IclR family transcriptional regulator
VGKAYMAALDLREREALLDKIDYCPMTPNTLVKRRDLERDLRITARRGYSIDREETELDIICFGCAIRGATGKPVGSLSITVPKYRMDKAAEHTCKEGIVACARQISTRISAITEQDAF